MDKIEELVKWVASLSCNLCPGSDCTCDCEKCSTALTHAKMVLSHPDLALMDRGRMTAGLPPHERYCYTKGWLPVVRLAEALKEK